MSVAASRGGKAVYRIKPDHLAWSILLAAFVLFCLLLLGALLTINFFLFQSALPMNATLNVSRGTVSISDLANPFEQVGVNGSVIAGGAIVRTDLQSQGTIQFMVGEEQQRLVVALTLQRDSSVTLLSAERPRFPWSRRSYEISLQDVFGEINVLVTEHAGPELLVFGVTPGRARLRITGPGTYTIEGASEELRLFNHDGVVELESADGRQIRTVPAGVQGAVRYEQPRVELRPGYRNLLLDADFARLRSDADSAGDRAWTCDHDPDDNPAGAHEFVMTDGLQPLRFLRAGGGITSHGRNFCVQNFGQNGLVLQDQPLDYLALRVSFFVESASLGTCGIDGSECPLMLRMDYLDEDYLSRGGDAKSWYHGFYIRSRDGWSLRCDTCLQNHELINSNGWYVYESPNLLNLFTPEPPPEVIISLMVYASGHEYDVRVRDVALLAIPQES